MANASSGSGKSLREHIQQEITKKLKFCANQTYQCTLPRLDGYEYCMRHILRDGRNHFRICSYTYGNGRKCPNAVPKYDLKKDPSMTTFCYEHSRQVQLRKTHEASQIDRPIDTNESLLNSITHHITIEDVEEEKKAATDTENEEEIDVVSPYVPTFNLRDQTKNIRGVCEGSRKRPRVIDYGSDSSSSEDEPIIAKNTFPGYDYNDSDNESISDDDDVLRHAGVYTQEEVVRITLEKTMKLRDLYMDQLNHLHSVLKAKRRRYLIDLKKERETLCSITDQIIDNPHQQEQAAELKALNSYHRRHGQEAILYKKFKEKRSRQNESHMYKGQGYIKCMFTEGGVKCGERSLPCCKFCRKHILEDKKQVLFKACHVEKGGVICQEPVPFIFEESACILHLQMPPIKQFAPKKFESDSEEEEIIEIRRQHPSQSRFRKIEVSLPPPLPLIKPINPNVVVLPEIKVEDIDYPSTSAHARGFQN